MADDRSVADALALAHTQLPADALSARVKGRSPTRQLALQGGDQTRVDVAQLRQRTQQERDPRDMRCDGQEKYPTNGRTVAPLDRCCREV